MEETTQKDDILEIRLDSDGGANISTTMSRLESIYILGLAVQHLSEELALGAEEEQPTDSETEFDEE